MLLVMVFAIGVVGALTASRLQAPHAAPEQLPIIVNDVSGAAQPEANSAAIAETTTGNDGSLQIPRNPNGHFYADVDVNGTKLHMLIDTGATGVDLSREDARAAGIAISIGMNEVVGEGADGSVHGEIVTVDRMSLGNARAEAMPAIVLNSGGQSLLGQEFLAKFASVEIHGDTMTLK